ncbi:stage 0 sporulation protein [Candidatus Fermentibacteria bacterium]|nr:stage 0 sporulation protein [Candidatus Fermentibacteria bacterium]
MFVVVSADKGEDLGRVAKTDVLRKAMRRGTIRTLVRLATPDDVGLLTNVRAREDSFFSLCQARIRARNLPMKLVDVESQFDGNRVTFFFTAETRVDFRTLVRDLADTFKTRIELRQIGVRDHAKRTGGCGSCGLPLCCTTFLHDFQPVTLRMARDQSVSLSPSKISGVCGRLKCCLAFEHSSYESPSRVPSPGESVVRDGVEMTVVTVDESEGLVVVVTPDGEELSLSMSEWEEAGHER